MLQFATKKEANQHIIDTHSADDDDDESILPQAKKIKIQPSD